jgi:hypothetical protein
MNWMLNMQNMETRVDVFAILRLKDERPVPKWWGIRYSSQRKRLELISQQNQQNYINDIIMPIILTTKLFSSACLALGREHVY